MINEKDNLEKKQDFDNHEIRSDWEDIKSLIEEVEPDIDRFLQLKGVTASVRVRNKLSQIKKLCLRIRQGIQYQKQDNRSEY